MVRVCPFWLCRLVIFLVAILLVSIVVLNILYWWLMPRSLYDFGSFIASGLAFARGLNPYGNYDLTNRAVVHGRTLFGPNLNPPLLLPFFEFLALFDPTFSYGSFVALSGLTYLVCLALSSSLSPLRLTPLRFLWAFTPAALWYTWINGQVYVLLLLLVSLAWRSMCHNQEHEAGLWIGLVAALKPNFLLWPVLLLLSGRTRLASVAFGVFALSNLASLVALGPTVNLQWLEVLIRRQEITAPWDISLFNAASLMGLPAAGVVGSAVMILSVFVLVRLWRPSALVASQIAISSTLLISPLSIGYLLVLLPSLLSRFWNISLTLSAICLSVPRFLVLGVPDTWPLSLLASAGVLVDGIGHCTSAANAGVDVPNTRSPAS